MIRHSLCRLRHGQWTRCPGLCLTLRMIRRLRLKPTGANASRPYRNCPAAAGWCRPHEQCKQTTRGIRKGPHTAINVFLTPACFHARTVSSESRPPCRDRIVSCRRQWLCGTSVRCCRGSRTCRGVSCLRRTGRSPSCRSEAWLSGLRSRPG